MANITKKQTLNIKNALIDLSGEKVSVSIEDGGTYNLADLLKDFDGTEVSISISTAAEIE